TGTKVCSGGSISCSQTTQASPELCNGLDDDCDGTVDDNAATVGDSCSTGLNGVCSTGTKVCSGGSISCSQTTQSSAESCNGLDDDCDGTIDNGIAPLNCGVGACAVTAPGCVNGMPGTCTPGQPTTETCNGLDDDCDGAVDQNLFCNNVCLTGCLGGVPNGACEPNENSFNCAQDCACGDGTCSGSETPENCHADCKFTNDLNGMCGNHHCDPWEVDYGTQTISCQADCWDGVTRAGMICGDGSCAPQEDATKCSADCGNPPSNSAYVNGNGVCDPDEHWSTSVDCPPNIDAGTFLKAECQGYALVETYADGNGGTTSHTVTNCSESCGAAPWKMLEPDRSQTGFNGVQVLRPDCSICTISGLFTPNIVGEPIHGHGWVSVYDQNSFEMELDPNTCNTAIYPYNPGTPFYSYIIPLEWAKVGERQCSQASPCDARDCTGAHYPLDSGTVGIWKPAYGSWSMYEAYCH
ncbi:MAG TPA: MopE-related protein, partial [Polyangium sp.]|nr:MopE-related protein [Polyangium sp.]